ncbi:PREDICTED: DNA replication licensing factor MCM6-like, partial [Brassica oleracea var. oleracea]
MQETSKEIPAGSLPRSLDVFLRHEIVEQARAGDTVIFTGAVIVLPDISAMASPGERAKCRRDSSQQKSSTAGHEGFKGLKALGVRDLSYRLSFIANSVQIADGSRNTDTRHRQNDSNEDDQQQFTGEELYEIQLMKKTPDYFNKLVGSMAPTVFRHQDIKRAILLMLLGGVHKTTTHEGINLRGDIN